MPTLDPQYMLMPPLQQVIHDKADGSLLTFGYVTFYQDTARTILKPVYQLSRSPSNEYIYTQLVNPLRLSGIGSYVDENGNNIIPYLKPYDALGAVDLYYITVESQDHVFQFDMEAWPNTIFSSGEDIFDSSGNQISNPQFTQISFTPSLTTGAHVYTVSGSNHEVEVAPGWTIRTSGTGTVTVKQTAVVDTGAITSPPFALDITSSGITSLSLRQRFANSPRLFVGGHVNASIVVNSQNGSSSPITVSYVPSSGTAHVFFSSTIGASSVFQEFFGTTTIAGGTINPTPATTGYVDFVVTIQPSAHIQITSLQMVSVLGENSILPFQQESSQRQLDFLFHYYKQWLAFKPVTNLMTAWDFALNPAQFGGPTQTIDSNAITGNCKYIWDQTICGRAVGDYDVIRNSVNSGFQATSTVANSSFFMMQYLTKDDISDIRQTPISINVLARVGNVGDSNMKIYLFRAPPTASIPTLPAGIGTLNAAGEFTLTAAGWTEVPRADQGLATADLETGVPIDDMGFNQWQIVDASQLTNTSYLACVVTFSTTTLGTQTIVDSINVCSGNVPCRPAPEAPTDVLQQCQYYYEKTYQAATAPGTVTTVGSRIEPTFYTAVAITTDGYVSSFTMYFQNKRLVLSFTGPTKNITFYTTTIATADRMGIRVFRDGVVVPSNVTPGANIILNPINTGSGSFDFGNYLSLSSSSNSSAMILSVDTSTLAVSWNNANGEVFLQYHFVIDQRLGVV